MLQNFIKSKKKQIQLKILNAEKIDDLKTIIDQVSNKSENSENIKRCKASLNDNAKFELSDSNSNNNDLAAINNDSTLNSYFKPTNLIENQIIGKSLGNGKNDSSLSNTSLKKDALACESTFIVDGFYNLKLNQEIAGESDYLNLTKKPFNKEDDESLPISSGSFCAANKNSKVFLESEPAIPFPIKKQNYASSLCGDVLKSTLAIKSNQIEAMPYENEVFNKINPSNILKNSPKSLKNKIHCKNIIESIELEGSTTSTDQRTNSINSFPTRHIKIPYSIVNAALYLPNELKKLSSLYKIISTVYNFNKNRKIELIFIKYQKSIEKLFNNRAEMAYFEQLNYLLEENIKFIPITVNDSGEPIETFNIKINNEINIDEFLFNYFIKKYEEWLIKNGLNCAATKLLPEFRRQIIEIPRKEIFHKKNEPSEEQFRFKAKIEASCILERVKEKERLRREAFLKECEKKADYSEKIESIFLVANKKAIKISDLIFQIGGIHCRENVLRCCENQFQLKIIDGEEYLIKK